MEKAKIGLIIMKHGRKEQFSITIDTETADKFYEYQEKHNILYKNMAMESLLKKAFLHIDYMETNGKNQYALFTEATEQVMNLVDRLAPKNKTLKKAVKLHYETLFSKFEEAKVELDIN